MTDLRPTGGGHHRAVFSAPSAKSGSNGGDMMTDHQPDDEALRRYIEEEGIDVTVEFSGTPDEWDPAYIQTLKVTYALAELLEGFKHRIEAGDPEVHRLFTQAYIDELEAAFHAGERVLYHDRRDELKRDMTACEPDLLRELRGTIAYVGPHLGLDVDLPPPREDSER